MARFFTSDLHFGHIGVIHFCNRPWKTVPEMDEGLIKNWNAFVTPEDEVYILGDMFFCGKTRAKEIMARLNGTKILIAGNHDWDKIPRHRAEEFGFKTICDWTDTRIGGVQVRMSHFPYHGDHTTSDRYVEHRLADNGLPLLHGHVHNVWRIKERMINVGVDVWGWYPVPEACIEKLIQGLPVEKGEATIQG